MVLSVLFSACGNTETDKTTIELFFHSGQGGERDALAATLKAFQAKNPAIIVRVKQLPEGSYNNQVNAAALAHKLPCLLDFDGPNVYNYAWSGSLIPLDKYVSSDMKADFLPSIIQQGTYNNKLYSLGQFDSGLGFYASKKQLTQAGVRIPTFDKPWTLAELNDALAKLKTAPGIQYPLDLQMSNPNREWYTYGFAPFLQSFGGDLINRSNYQSADGKLNGPEAVAAMTWFQGLFKQKYVNPKPTDDTAFANGKSALSWVGHWMYPTYSQAMGADLLVLPAPNLGQGAKTGMGSWNWGITSACKNPDAAWKVLDFILSSDEVAHMTTVNGAVPARKSTIATSKLFADNGPLHVYAQQLQSDTVAVPRPVTPAYPAISTAFQDAVANIIAGSAVQSELDKATQKIDQDIKDNRGYQTQS
jgi:multiple sugar transport system substrate-binding protein